MAAANRFDTRIRLGTIDIGTKKSNIDFSLAGQASRSLEDFFVKLGKEVQFRPRQDGYVYLDLANQICRESASDPVASYTDLENAFVLMGDDKEMLEDLVLAAIGEAMRKSRELSEQRMAQITGGMSLPGLF